MKAKSLGIMAQNFRDEMFPNRMSNILEELIVQLVRQKYQNFIVLK